MIKNLIAGLIFAASLISGSTAIIIVESLYAKGCLFLSIACLPLIGISCALTVIAVAIQRGKL